MAEASPISSDLRSYAGSALPRNPSITMQRKAMANSCLENAMEWP